MVFIFEGIDHESKHWKNRADYFNEQQNFILKIDNRNMCTLKVKIDIALYLFETNNRYGVYLFKIKNIYNAQIHFYFAYFVKCR